MKKIILFALLFANLVPAQELKFNFSYSKFHYDSSSIFLETYYSFGQNTLTQIEENGVKKYKAILHLKIKELLKNTIFVDKDWLIEYPVAEMQNGERDILGTLGIVLPEGQYVLEATGTDFKNQDLKIKHNSKIEAKSFELENSLVLSNIQFATDITKSKNTKSIFYKNTYEVIPNPVSVFSEKKPVLFYYIELYKFNDSFGNQNIKLEKKLLNSRNELVREESKNIKITSSTVEVGRMNLSKLPSGKYTYSASLISDDKEISNSKKDFFFINSSVVDSTQILVYNTSFLTSEFGIMEEQEIEEHFAAIRHIATDEERSQFNSIDLLNAKRKFLFSFWFKRDSNSETQIIEELEEYKKRIKYVNKNFKTLGKKGIDTARGRVYLKFGKPDQVERFASEAEFKPYVVWYYHGIEGGVNFVFADITGYGNYELMTSNKRGEVVDENWRNKIKIAY